MFMLSEEQKTTLLKLAPGIKFDEPLKSHTYFQMGGPADAFWRYQDGYDYGPLKCLLCYCANERIPVTILGSGSNALVSDHGLLGLVLQLDTRHIQVADYGLSENPVPLQVSGGDPLRELAKCAEVLSLTGLEPFADLPGTVGGAVYHNPHDERGQSFGRFVRKVWAVSLPLLERDRENFYLQDDLEFGNGRSRFQRKPHSELIMVIEMTLPKGDQREIAALTEKLRRERRENPPYTPGSRCILDNGKGTLESK